MSFELNKVVLISFTAAGDRLAYELEKKLLDNGIAEQLSEKRLGKIIPKISEENERIEYGSEHECDIESNEISRYECDIESNEISRYECDRYCYETYNAYHGITFKSGRKVMENVFGECDYIIFIGACGMAVRMIDGLIRTKEKDPGIVVVDSEGKFAVSLLSGHLGGANELTGQIAEMIGAMPVITTATDVGGKFSPDMFAKRNHLYITDLNMAKQVAKTVLASGRIFIESDYEISNNSVCGIHLNDFNNLNGSINLNDSNKENQFDMVKYNGQTEIIMDKNGSQIESVMDKNDNQTEIVMAENDSQIERVMGKNENQTEMTMDEYDCHIDSAIYIGYDSGRLQTIKERYGNALWLIPKDIVIGVGCKRNTNESKFEDEILRHLKENDIDIRRVREIHTIDIKKDEASIKKFAKKYNIVCRFYSADELKNVNGEFLQSKFVESVTGVDNVCERSAVIDGEKLIVGKCAENGITFAAATYKKWRIIVE